MTAAGSAPVQHAQFNEPEDLLTVTPGVVMHVAPRGMMASTSP